MSAANSMRSECRSSLPSFLPWYGWGIFVLYCVAVLVLLTHHAVWRDEVRALNVAREASDPWDLISRCLVNEGHPALWHTLLWLGLQVSDNPVVLKTVSYLAALGFAGVFYFAAPFPLLVRALFLFGFFPLHHYSVVSRNYGISWLLLFLLAWEYSRVRLRSAVWVGLLNGLLANTNVYGAICSLAFLPVSPPPSPAGRNVRDRGVIAGLTLLGLMLAAFTLLPNEYNLTHAPLDRGGLALRPKTLPGLVTSLGEIALDSQGWCLFILTNLPAAVFHDLGVQLLIPILGTLVFWSGLVVWRRPALPFVAALVAGGLFSRHVYPAGDRHIGVLAGFLLALLWISESRKHTSDGRASRWVVRGMVLCLGVQALVGVRTAVFHASVPYSNSAKAGAFVRAHHPGDILLCEPDIYGESLSYYVENEFYLMREQRMGRRPIFDWRYHHSVSLSEWCAAAERLERETGRPVLLSLPCRPEETEGGVFIGAYNRNLTFTPEEQHDFARRYEEIAAFTIPVEERYVFFRRRH